MLANCLIAAITLAATQESGVVDGTRAEQSADDAYAAGFAAGLESGSQDAHFADRFSSREPFYFVVGWRGRTNARFQISFQYDFVAPEGALARKRNVWSEFAIAYTQTSVWDLETESVPFLDTSYRPSLFWHRKGIWSADDGRRWDMEAGYEHESNGRDGLESRSINILYVRPTYTHPLGDRWQFRTTPKLWGYIGSTSDNADIRDYRGWFDWRLQLIDPRGFGLSTNVRKGGESSYGSIQADLTYPMNRLLGKNLDLFLHLQYFNGWGETLLFYDEKAPSQFRIGFSLVR